MVKELKKEIYVCPYCDEKYDDECEAQECRDECCMKDDVETSSKIVYICEECEEEFDSEEKAIEHEKNHCNDGINKAREHKNQTRLYNYGIKFSL